MATIYKTTTKTSPLKLADLIEARPDIETKYSFDMPAVPLNSPDKIYLQLPTEERNDMGEIFDKGGFYELIDLTPDDLDNIFQSTTKTE